jgi:hypothetical protein
MSRLVNIANGASNITDAGLCLIERQTSGTGTLEFNPYTTIRVYCLTTGTITIDGVLACTLTANEIVLLNVSKGLTSDTKLSVTVVSTGSMRIQEVLTQ